MSISMSCCSVWSVSQDTSRLAVASSTQSTAIDVSGGGCGIRQKECNVVRCGGSCTGSGSDSGIEVLTGSEQTDEAKVSCFWAAYNLVIVFAAHRQTSARVLMFITAPSHSDTPYTEFSSGRLFLYRFRVRLLRCWDGWSSYVGKDHVGFWDS